MTASTETEIPVLSSDSLGNFLAALGVLSVCARKWPQVRCSWRDDRFVLHRGPESLDQLADWLLEIAASSSWTNYAKSWSDRQKKDTTKKTDTLTAQWRAGKAEEEELLSFSSHIVTTNRLQFNPLFGSGGNAGRRDFAKGWNDARKAVVKLQEKDADALKADLLAFLCNESSGMLAEYAAASWFSAANKTYNSGTRQPSRKGQISPWAMLLACEGIPFFAGTASRRLGAAAKSRAAFPFISTPLAAANETATGMELGVVWAPLWEERAFSLPEVKMLFARGRAEINGRGATSAAAFSAAILRRGVDAGICAFHTFTLCRTTSENTFESRLTARIPVQNEVNAAAQLAERALAIRNSFPYDSERKFLGLHGPVDRALLRFAEVQGTELEHEAGWELAEALFESLSKVDRNRTLRASRQIGFRHLPTDWARKALASEEVSGQARIARAVCSLRRRSSEPGEREEKPVSVADFLAYRLGVEREWAGWKFGKAAPARRVWGAGTLIDNLGAVVLRRLSSPESQARDSVSLGGKVTERDKIRFTASSYADGEDVEAFLLAKPVDDAEIDRWIRRLALFDPRSVQPAAAFSEAAPLPDHADSTADDVDSTLAGPAHPPPAAGCDLPQSGSRLPQSTGAAAPTFFLYALIRCLCDERLLAMLGLYADGIEKWSELKAKTRSYAPDARFRVRCGTMHQIAVRLWAGNVPGALSVARAAYSKAGVPLLEFAPDLFEAVDSRRILAALLIPVNRYRVFHAAKRWVRPPRNSTNSDSNETESSHQTANS